MKIVSLSGKSVTTGVPQTLPFTLGETGRGRETVAVQCQDPTLTDVEYLTVRGGPVILRASTGKQRGVLIRLNTRGAYTKGSCGEIAPIWGKVTTLAAGRWAEGDAGRVAAGPDALLHVEGPAFIRACLQGGSGKGWGWRCIVVTGAGAVWMGQTPDLAALITADERPDLSEVVRQMLAEVAPPTEPPVEGHWRIVLPIAIAAADALEAETPPESVGVDHYFLNQTPDWADLLKRVGVTLPGGQTAPEGVSEVKAGCLMPGPFSLVVISVGPGGGKRYRYEITAEKGVTVIGRDQGRGYETVVAIVQDQDWQIAWSSFKDGALTSQSRAQIDGVWTQAADGSDPELLPWA